MMPKDENEGQHMVKTAAEYNDGPIVLRYPRGNGLGVPLDEELHSIPIGTWEVLRDGKDAVILTFGTTIPMAMEAAEELAKRNIHVKVVNARFIKPLDDEMLHEIMSKNMPILTIEEGVLKGGFGSAILEFASDNKYNHIEIERMGIPDRFVDHGSVDLLLEELHITKEETIARIESLVKNQKRLGKKTV
jgi:1-deoxy-D-xylulose-5-phosphate synthase